MLLEAIAALAVGLAIMVLILEPLVRVEPAPVVIRDPEKAEESPRGQALTALREIEFDRATGKLSDADYDSLKQRYTTVALDAIRADTSSPAGDDIEAQVAARVVALRGGAAVCPACGPRPESDALFCSQCGRSTSGAGLCRSCQKPVQPGSRFCEGCGEKVAA